MGKCASVSCFEHKKAALPLFEFAKPAFVRFHARGRLNASTLPVLFTVFSFLGFRFFRLVFQVKEICVKVMIFRKQKQLHYFMQINGLLHYERGCRTLPIEHLLILSDFYNTSTDYLLGRTNDPTPPQK